MTLLTLTAYLLALAVLAYVSITDIRERRIPNRVMFPALAVALILALLRTDRWWLLLGGLLAGALMLVPVFLYGLENAGGGDVKLAAFLGLVLGWPTVIYALALAFVSAALFGAVGVALRRLSRRSTVAFAPFMALGWLAGAAITILGGGV
jgi:leader peptidase (prepilin peptidase)/N-methyltransferase